MWWAGPATEDIGAGGPAVRERTEAALGLGCLALVVLGGFVILVVLVLSQTGSIGR